MKQSKIPEDDKRIVKPNFITEIIDDDLKSGKLDYVITRFPPEPNGYAHIGHTYASFINFMLAHDYNGRCHLRMDDTNPLTEKQEYADSLAADFKWLGWDWGEHLYYASDYFEQLYELAIRLIKDGKAYVDSLSEEEIREYRGTVKKAGKESPYRNRSIAENLKLFEEMQAGKHAEGSHVLRAKIDMASNNMKMRDPLLYRIVHASHYRTADKWKVYPMYDFAHGLSDAIEGVTHSLCSLEFIDNRAVYDWLVDNLFETNKPHQYEFGRRSLEYTIVSKRKLLKLVEGNYVSGWDDPRMPTLSGLRRRGVRAEAIRDLASRIGVARTNRTVDISLLEYSIRDDLNREAKRLMAVLEPLAIRISNLDEVIELDAAMWPNEINKNESRKLSFANKLYIEKTDFSENPAKGFKRLSPGEHVRLRHGFIIRCEQVIKKDSEIIELVCSYLPDSLGKSVEGIKVKGAIHWLSEIDAIKAEFRLFDRLFSVANPESGEKDFIEYLNPKSLLIKNGFVEKTVLKEAKDSRFQFERLGYFWQDPIDSKDSALVFNRIVSLKDNWAKLKTVLKTEAKVHVEGIAKDPSLDFNKEQKQMLSDILSLGIPREEAILIAQNIKLGGLLKEAIKTHNNPKDISKWIVNELRRELKDDSEEIKLKARDLANLIALIDEGKINNRIAKDVFAQMLKTFEEPEKIISQKGLGVVASVDKLEPIILKVLTENQDKVNAFKAGKTGLMGFFVGQIMRETKGQASPQIVQKLLKEKLK